MFGYKWNVNFKKWRERSVLCVCVCVFIYPSSLFSQERVPDMWNEPPSVSVEKEFMRQHIDELLNTLKPMEKRIVRLRYGFEDGQPKRLVEIGEVFGFSKQRVDFIVKKAMSKLRQRSQELVAYKYLIMYTWKDWDLNDIFPLDEDWFMCFLINFVIPSRRIKRWKYPIIK